MEYPILNRNWSKTHSDTDKSRCEALTLATAFHNDVCCRYPSWNFLEERISLESVMAIDSDS